jgi:DNA processing protein
VTTNDLQALVRSLLVDEDEMLTGSDGLTEVTAAVVFSHLAEPGDRFMGALQEAVGFGAALEILTSGKDFKAAASALPSEAAHELADIFRTDIQILWRNALERWAPRLDQADILGSLRQAADLGANVLTRESVLFPNGMADLGHGMPAVLWCKGNSEMLSAELPVAIVGTRNATRYGAEVCADLTQTAAEHELVTVSGGAYGIDAIVHQATLNAHGNTVAFLAGGLANLYPKGNLSLLERVAAHGLLVAEQPPATTPAKWRFLMRNRLIAAMARGTVVVQAGKTSGALSTANHAISLDRPVGVVPGPIDSPHSVGCHDLLNNHPGQVRLIARPSEILELAGISVLGASAAPSLGILERRALDTFSAGPLESWEVQRLAGLTVRETQIALGSLQLSDHVTRVGARYVRTTT